MHGPARYYQKNAGRLTMPQVAFLGFRRRFLIALFAASILITPIPAQVGTASLSGFITDSSGASVPSAAMTLKSTLQKYTRETVSSSGGVYTIPALPPGEYELSVTAPGFAPATKTGIRLSSGQASTLDVGLTVASA